MVRTSMRSAALVVMLLAVAGCSSDLTKSASPIQLVASNTQLISRIDLAGGANCSGTLGTIHVQAIQKNPGAPTSNFQQVRITGYQVSYVRTDGGKLVPAPFTRSMDSLITTGGAPTDLSNFLILQPEALNLAPFASLIPANGGRDPDTNQTTIRMNVIVDIFGETLAGDRVSASTTFPLDFCYQCNGCF